MANLVLENMLVYFTEVEKNRLPAHRIRTLVAFTACIMTYGTEAFLAAKNENQ